MDNLLFPFSTWSEAQLSDLCFPSLDDMPDHTCTGVLRHNKESDFPLGQIKERIRRKMINYLSPNMPARKSFSAWMICWNVVPEDTRKGAGILCSSGMPTFRLGCLDFRSGFPSDSGLLLVCTLGGSRPCSITATHVEVEMECQLLTSAWPRPDSCGHLGVKQWLKALSMFVLVSFLLSAFQVNKHNFFLKVLIFLF